MRPTVLVCGSRDWTDYATILEALYALPRDTRIVHGDCRGADRIAAKAALYLGMEVVAYPARWAEEGQAAGPLRNQRMLDEARPTMVYAFHPDLANSKGTRDMVRKAERAGVEVRIFTGGAPVSDGLYQVSTAYLCAGFVVEGGRVTSCAPILRKRLPYWMRVAVRIGP